MATLSSRRASLGSVGASWAFFRGGIGRRRPTGGGGVLGETGCKGIDTLEEREALLGAFGDSYGPQMTAL
jgi:hypothetical protein